MVISPIKAAPPAPPVALSAVKQRAEELLRLDEGDRQLPRPSILFVAATLQPQPQQWHCGRIKLLKRMSPAEREAMFLTLSPDDRAKIEYSLLLHRHTTTTLLAKDMLAKDMLAKDMLAKDMPPTFGRRATPAAAETTLLHPLRVTKEVESLRAELVIQKERVAKSEQAAEAAAAALMQHQVEVGIQQVSMRQERYINAMLTPF